MPFGIPTGKSSPLKGVPSKPDSLDATPLGLIAFGRILRNRSGSICQPTLREKSRCQLLKMSLAVCLVSGALFIPATAAEEAAGSAGPKLALNDLEYFEMPGLNVMLGQDNYPEGHQSGLTIIQNGLRVAANGGVRLDAAPGQWQPVPKPGKRSVDTARQEISMHNAFPDPARNRTGGNPIDYPDLNLAYTVRVRSEGKSFLVSVDLDEPLPERWNGKVGFNLELFPGILFGKTYCIDGRFGGFPRQANGPGAMDGSGHYELAALGTGRKLVVAPESDRQRLTIEAIQGGNLELEDGRGEYNNGWFIVRAALAPGATRRALEWRVTPHAILDWKSAPVVQISQVGYHPDQQKIAVIELDRRDTNRPAAVLERLREDGGVETVLETRPAEWGRFLRCEYLRFDFSAIQHPGAYVVRYGESRSQPFLIDPAVFKRNVWQPTLEYFLPIQMCHMRVNDRYRVWHGACHLDDARMAPTNYIHFDSYHQGPSTLCRFQSGEHVPGLDRGGWHDAGDYDLRIESQSDTIYGLALAFEEFGVDYDDTTVDQSNRLVELHRPDGKPDILQQIEHGALGIAGGYHALGRFYRGIIEPTLRQYTHLGDPVTITDNRVFDPASLDGKTPPPVGEPGSPDDRWVFTEDNPARELRVAAGLAAASRALRGFNDSLASDCLAISRQVWLETAAQPAARRVPLAVELLLATTNPAYADFLVNHREAICSSMRSNGWVIGRALPLIGRKDFTDEVTKAAVAYGADVKKLEQSTPYGVPYEPNIWGAGWTIQKFGREQYFLHKAFPQAFPAAGVLNALNFVLGCHPGPNTASFVSGVGARSTLVAYGFTRADWTYIPGGIVSGTALIRPDFPELLEWPYLWQQTEYVLGGGTTDYLFLVLAADAVTAQQ
jgi:endoglucanase